MEECQWVAVVTACVDISSRLEDGGGWVWMMRRELDVNGWMEDGDQGSDFLVCLSLSSAAAQGLRTESLL